MILYPPLYQCSNGTPRDVPSLLALRTQGFGERPEVYGPGGHSGSDWGCAKDTPIHAMHDGNAVLKEDRNPDGSYKGYGLYVILQGPGVQTYYGHLDKAGKLGPVKAGEVIGYADSTGFSSGHHLHVTCKELDQNGLVKNRDNGHDGAVDFSAWLVWRPESILTGMTPDEVKAIYKVLRVKDYTQADVDFWTGKYWLDMLRQGSKDYAADLNTL